MKQKTVYIDLECLLEDGKLVKEIIEKVNEKYDEGFVIIIWTNDKDHDDELFLIKIYNQLVDVGLNFHQLKSGKPDYDIIIDKKSIDISFLKNLEK